MQRSMMSSSASRASIRGCSAAPRAITSVCRPSRCSVLSLSPCAANLAVHGRSRVVMAGGGGSVSSAVEVVVTETYSSGFVCSLKTKAQADGLVAEHNTKLVVFMCKSTTCKWVLRGSRGGGRGVGDGFFFIIALLPALAGRARRSCRATPSSPSASRTRCW
jgi:hypothetical protein